MSDGNGGGGGGGGGGGSLNFRPSIGQVVSMVMTAQKMKKGVGARRSGPKLWEEKLLEVEERERRTKVIADVWMAEKDGMLKIKRAAEAVDREIQGRDEKSIEILNSLDVKWEAHKMAAIHARKTFAERWGQQNDDVLKLSGEWIERMRWTEHQLQRGEIQLPWERAIAGEDDKKIKARSPVGARTFRSSTLSHGRRPGEVQAQPDGIGIFGDSAGETRSEKGGCPAPPQQKQGSQGEAPHLIGERVCGGVKGGVGFDESGECVDESSARGAAELEGGQEPSTGPRTRWAAAGSFRKVKADEPETREVGFLEKRVNREWPETLFEGAIRDFDLARRSLLEYRASGSMLCTADSIWVSERKKQESEFDEASSELSLQFKNARSDSNMKVMHSIGAFDDMAAHERLDAWGIVNYTRYPAPPAISRSRSPRAPVRKVGGQEGGGDDGEGGSSRPGTRGGGGSPSRPATSNTGGSGRRGKASRAGGSRPITSESSRGPGSSRGSPPGRPRAGSPGREERRSGNVVSELLVETLVNKAPKGRASGVGPAPGTAASFAAGSRLASPPRRLGTVSPAASPAVSRLASTSRRGAGGGVVPTSVSPAMSMLSSTAPTNRQQVPPLLLPDPGAGPRPATTRHGPAPAWIAETGKGIGGGFMGLPLTSRPSPPPPKARPAIERGASGRPMACEIGAETRVAAAGKGGGKAGEGRGGGGGETVGALGAGNGTCVTPRSEAETAPSSRRGSIMSMGDMAESMLLGPRFAPPCKKGVGGGVDVVLVDNGRLMIDTPRVEASPCPSSIGPNELLPPLSTPPPPPLPCR